jgi:hypothetical protein
MVGETSPSPLGCFLCLVTNKEWGNKGPIDRNLQFLFPTIVCFSFTLRYNLSSNRGLNNLLQKCQLGILRKYKIGPGVVLLTCPLELYTGIRKYHFPKPWEETVHMGNFLFPNLTSHIPLP